MIVKAIRTALQVIFSTQAVWKITLRTKVNLYNDFLLPLWILIIAASLLGGWFFTQNGSFEIGLRNAIIEFFTICVGFYIASFFLNESIASYTEEEKNLKKTKIFVAYSSSLLYLIDICVSIFSDFFFLWLFVLYTFYIVYIGASTFYKISIDKRGSFMVIASLLIIGIPLLIKFGFSFVIND